MLLPFPTLIATPFQLLHNNVLRAILFAAMHEKQAAVNVNPMIWDVGAQQGLVGESSPEKVQQWRVERKLLNVLQVC